MWLMMHTRPRMLVLVLLLTITMAMIMLLRYNRYRSTLVSASERHDQTAYFRAMFLVDLPRENDTAPLPEFNREHNLTVVTAFFKIGLFPKGSYSNMRGSESYVEWLRGFSSLLNPVMFFTDDASIKQKFENWRSPSRDARLCTVAYLVKREDFWPWRCLSNISAALSSKQYYPSPPCTTNPEYDAATNSKYPVTERAIQLNPFRTKYFAWLDAGIYRNSINAEEVNSFYLLLPLPSLQPDRVGYLEIYPKPTATLEAFILNHIDWIAGGMFYGEADAMLKWTREYSRFAQVLMRRQLVGADQQILGAMYGGTNNVAAGIGYPVVQLQLYKPIPSASPDPWFHLAYLTRKKVDR